MVEPASPWETGLTQRSATFDPSPAPKLDLVVVALEKQKQVSQMCFRCRNKRKGHFLIKLTGSVLLVDTIGPFK